MPSEHLASRFLCTSAIWLNSRWTWLQNTPFPDIPFLSHCSSNSEFFEISMGISFFSKYSAWKFKFLKKLIAIDFQQVAVRVFLQLLVFLKPWNEKKESDVIDECWFLCNMNYFNSFAIAIFSNALWMAYNNHSIIILL